MTRLTKSLYLFVCAGAAFSTPFVGAAFITALAGATPARAQTIDTHTTVRHHREQVVDQPAEIAQAEDAIEKKDFALAETLLKKAIESQLKDGQLKDDEQKNDSELQKNTQLQKDPDSKAPWLYQAWFDLGFALNGLNRADDSIAAYRKSVAAKADVFESNLNLGLMLEREHSPEAEQFLRAATTLKPTAHVEEGRARAWLSLAHVLEARDPAQALQAYNKAAELAPTDPEPHLAAALLDEHRKDFAGAEAEYKKVLAGVSYSVNGSGQPHDANPAYTEAAIGLANIYMKSGRVAEAEPPLRRLVAERPGDAAMHLQLARVLAAEVDKKDDAIAEYQAALKLAPNESEAQRELADLYASAGKNDLAEAAYRPLVASNPKDAELHRALGKALLLQKKFVEAQQELLVAVRLKRDEPNAYVDLAEAANENKDYDLMIRALNGRAALQPEMPGICYFLRATAYDHVHDYKQAAPDYHHFLDTANGKYPDQEWQARHRLIAIEPKKR